MNSKVIEISNLTKTYGKYRGITNLNLEVNQGEIYGFLGPNGAGKSTTIRSMLGLIKYQEGTVKILGKDNKKELISILDKIGYMPSEAMFYPSMKVEEVIKFAAKNHKKDCSYEAKKLCERLQVDTKKRIDELSLGNRKKVSIVCAMQHKPDLFIFDEPTSGLDPLMQKEFFDLILEYNKLGATCFLSSHVLSEIKKYCDKVAIVKEGQLICIDTVDNLSEKNTKKVHIRGISQLPNLDGIVNLIENKNEFDFVYNGDINLLIQNLKDVTIEELLIEEPALDEVFMHFYEKGDK